MQGRVQVRGSEDAGGRQRDEVQQQPQDKIGVHGRTTIPTRSIQTRAGAKGRPANPRDPIGEKTDVQD